MENYKGIITEKLIKKTYWQIKLKIGVKDNGEDKVVTLNTKEEGFWSGLNIGDEGEFNYNESEVPGTADKDTGKPFKMKWIVLDNQSPKVTPASNEQLDLLKSMDAKLDKLLGDDGEVQTSDLQE